MFFFFFFFCLFVSGNIRLAISFEFSYELCAKIQMKCQVLFCSESNNDTKECIYFCGRLKFLILWFGIMTWIHLHCTMYNCLCFYIKVENKTKQKQKQQNHWFIARNESIVSPPTHPHPHIHTQTHTDTHTHTTTTSSTNIMPINISHCDLVEV